MITKFKHREKIHKIDITKFNHSFEKADSPVSCRASFVQGPGLLTMEQLSAHFCRDYNGDRQTWKLSTLQLCWQAQHIWDC